MVYSNKVAVKNKVSNWSHDDMPKLKLANPGIPAQIEFAFLKNDSEIGTARTIAYPGYPKKGKYDLTEIT